MKLLSLVLLLLLIGCGHNPKEKIVVSYILVPVECEKFNPISSIRTLPVKWVNSTDEAGNQTLGLRGDQYSNLSINSAEIIRYITEQSESINYYWKCIEDHNSIQLSEEGEP